MFEPIREILFAGCMIGASVVTGFGNEGKLQQIEKVPGKHPSYELFINGERKGYIVSYECNVDIRITLSLEKVGLYSTQVYMTTWTPRSIP